MNSIQNLLMMAQKMFGQGQGQGQQQPRQTSIGQLAANAPMMQMPTGADNAYTRGMNLLDQGDSRQAEMLWRQAIAEGVHAPEAKRGIERIENRRKLKWGMPTKPESNNFYRQGLDAFLGGDQQSAESYWTAALEQDPSNLMAQRGLERIRGREQ